jgi:hypothetical protein
MLSTKISGLAIHTEYTFHLVLRTSAGTYQSEKLTCRTHKMTDLSGITVTPGNMAPQQSEALERALDRVGGRLIDTVRIDTTHFVCTEGRGPLWEKAVEMNIPVVRPEWMDACEAEGTIVGVRGYYLNADPKQRQLGPRSVSQQQQQQHQVTASNVSNATTPPSGSQLTLPSRPGPETVPDGPTTPFPGGQIDLPNHQGEGEDSRQNEQGDETPPPPPPKDDASEPDDEEEEGHDEEENDDDDEDEETEEPEAKVDTAAVQLRSDEGAEAQKANRDATGRQHEGEGELDEVPL